jgi:EmrB/QacA subfamily drug resistance transporter
MAAVTVEEQAPAPLEIAPDVYARRWVILAVLCLALLVVSLDNTILNVALPTLVSSLHATATQLQWVLDAYTLVFASMLLTAGSLGDKFGRRHALIGGLFVFGIFSALSAFTGSTSQLIATRAVMGLAGAFIMPATLSILTNVFPAGERARAIGIWAGVSGLGVAIGPIAGGLLLRNFWWGSVFLVNVPVVIVALVAARAVVPQSRNPHAPPLDPLGTVLSIVGLVGVLFAIIEGPTRGWTSPEIIASLVVGLAVVTAFVVWELHSDHPMLNVRFFRNPRFSAASAAVALVFFALFGSLLLFTQYLQDVLGYNPLQAGIRVTPVALALMLASPAGAALVPRLGAKTLVAGGLLIVSGSLALMSRARVGTGFTAGYDLVVLSIVLLGVGMGLAMSPATDSIMGSIPPEEAGVGSAVNDTTREVGGALGVAVLGSISNSAYRHAIAASPVISSLPAPARAAAANSVGAAKAVAASVTATAGPAAGRAVAHAADSAFVHGMTSAVLVGAAVALAGSLVALLFLPAFAHVPAGAMSDITVAAARSLPRPATAPAPSLADTTLAILCEAGHASLNFNAVSAQSGVGTRAVRDAWSDRLRTVVDGVAQLVGEPPPRLDGASVVDDVAATVGHLARTIRERVPAPVLSALVGAAGRDPDLASALRRSVLEPREAVLRDRLDRAATAGELSPDVDRNVLVDVLLGPVYHRALITGQALEPGFPGEVVSIALGPHVRSPH